MIPKRDLIPLLRAANYTYKNRTKRRELWKHRGSTKRLLLPRAKQVDPLIALDILVKTGMPREEAERWIEDHGR